MKVKGKPEDFRVEEVLSLNPLRGKRGKYRYYRLFKRGMETSEAVNRVARLSQLKPRDVLYGGLKDKNAETVQFIAVKEPLRLKELNEDNLKVEFVGRLDRAPREVLKGNRFEVVVRGVRDLPPDRLEVLRNLGLPNYYGEQRFTPVRGEKFFITELLKSKEEAVKYLFTPAGWEGSALRRAKKLFVEGKFSEAARLFKGWRRRVSNFLARGGDWDGAFKLIPQSELEFQANVLQSYLFNELLSRLVRERSSRALKFKYKLGYLYYPLEEIPLPSSIASFTPQVALYDEILKDLGVKREELLPLSPLFHPFKRKALVKPEQLEVERLSEGYRLKFFLPAGSYATNLLRFLFSAV